jgi:hypothetical protein
MTYEHLNISYGDGGRETERVAILEGELHQEWDGNSKSQ